MRWTDAARREVVDTSTAESIGRIDDVVVDPTQGCITGLVVGGRLLSLSDTGGIGADALTVPSSDLLREPETDAESAAASGATNPISKPVYTEDGYLLGGLEDMEFDPVTGQIGRLLLSDDDIAGSRLVGVGSFAAVVTAPDHVTDADDLHQLTKSELYERAKAHDIDGRSTMSKDELIAALR